MLLSGILPTLLIGFGSLPEGNELPVFFPWEMGSTTYNECRCPKQKSTSLLDPTTQMVLTMDTNAGLADRNGEGGMLGEKCYIEKK